MKGLELPYTAAILGLVTLMVIVFLILLFVSQIYRIHTIVYRFDADIKAINLAQLLLSSDRLAYINGSVKRGVFDKTKLDIEVKEPMDLDIWYPDAMVSVGIVDIETGQEWLGIISPEIVAGTKFDDLLFCLRNTLRIEWRMIFRAPPLSPWETYDLSKCFLEAKATSGVRTFPVAIKVGDEIHAGKLILTVVDL